MRLALSHVSHCSAACRCRKSLELFVAVLDNEVLFIFCAPF